MSLNVYTIGSVIYNSTIIRDIREGSIDPQMQKIILGGSGGLERTFAAVGKVSPIANFTTGDIKNALNTLGGINGVGFSSSEYVQYLKKLVDGAQIGSTLAHIKQTVIKGQVLPQQLTISDTESAILNYLVNMISADGSTSPFTQETAQSLPAGSDQAAEAYILGDISLNGTALEGVSNVTVNFGLSPIILGGNGLVYPTFAAVNKRAITITITAVDAEAFASWGVTGQAQSVTDSTIEMQDVTEGSTRGTSPITLTIDEGLMHSTGLRYSDGSPVENTILIEVTYDGTAAPIVFSGLT